MQQKLKTILEESKKQLERATSLKEAEETRIKVLGKKGALTEIWEAFLPRKEKNWDRQPIRCAPK